MHKVLDDCGIRLGCVVSDIDGVPGRAMVIALIEGERTPEQIAQPARGQLRKKHDEPELALDGPISDRHRSVLRKILEHIEYLDGGIEAIDVEIVAAMKPYKEEWGLVQTLPGFDRISAAMLLIETGVDMSRCGSKERIGSWAPALREGWVACEALQFLKILPILMSYRKTQTLYRNPLATTLSLN